MPSVGFSKKRGRPSRAAFSTALRVPSMCSTVPDQGRYGFTTNHASALFSRCAYPPMSLAPVSLPPTSRMTLLLLSSSSGTSPPTCVGASAHCCSKCTVTPAPSKRAAASLDRSSGFVWSRSKKCTSRLRSAAVSAHCTASSDLPHPASPRNTVTRCAGSGT